MGSRTLNSDTRFRDAHIRQLDDDPRFDSIIKNLVAGYANQNDPCANCHKRRYEHHDHQHTDPCVFGDCGDFE